MAELKFSIIFLILSKSIPLKTSPIGIASGTLSQMKKSPFGFKNNLSPGTHVPVNSLKFLWTLIKLESKMRLMNGYSIKL